MIFQIMGGKYWFPFKSEVVCSDTIVLRARRKSMHTTEFYANDYQNVDTFTERN